MTLERPQNGAAGGSARKWRGRGQPTAAAAAHQPAPRRLPLATALAAQPSLRERLLRGRGRGAPSAAARSGREADAVAAARHHRRGG